VRLLFCEDYVKKLNLPVEPEIAEIIESLVPHFSDDQEPDTLDWRRERLRMMRMLLEEAALGMRAWISSEIAAGRKPSAVTKHYNKEGCGWRLNIEPNVRSRRCDRLSGTAEGPNREIAAHEAHIRVLLSHMSDIQVEAALEHWHAVTGSGSEITADILPDEMAAVDAVIAASARRRRRRHKA
jgi:hypothetical protein